MRLIQKMVNENKVENFNTLEHFIMLKEGDKSQRDIIIGQWLGLAFKISNSFAETYNCDSNDYFSTAVEGLIRAVDTFDISKGIEFSTYATTCITRSIIRFKQVSVRNQFLSLDVPCCEENDKSAPLDLVDMIVYDEDKSDYDKIDLKMECDYIFSKMGSILTEREMEILKHRFGLIDGICWTYREIEDKFGVTGVYEIINRSITKIQTKMFSKKSIVNKESLTFQTHLKQKVQLVYSMKDKLDKILTNKELEVINIRFGLLDGKIKTQNEVNEILCLGKNYVGATERRALLKLQMANSNKFKDSVCSF